MIGVDTNVLVRYLVQDDPAQSQRAIQFFEQEVSSTMPAFVPLIVLIETCWVLQRAYRVSKTELLDLIEQLMTTSEIVIENRAVVERATRRAAKTQCGIADAIIAASAEHADCDRTVTFDRRAVRAGMTLLDH